MRPRLRRNEAAAYNAEWKDAVERSSTVRHARPVRPLLAVLMCLLAGCGIVWETEGRHHAVGFGWVSWPDVPVPAGQAAVSGIDTIGVAVFMTRAGAGTSVGYLSERVVSLPEQAVVALDCLACDLATARPVGAILKQGSPP